VSLFTSAAGAQAFTPQIGIDAGVLRATLVGPDSEGASDRTAPFVGATFVLQPAGFGFGLLTGLYYAPRGAQLFSGSIKQKVNLAYLEIPILASYRLPLRLRGTQVGAALLGGLTLGMRSGCSIATETAGAPVSAACSSPARGPSISVGKLDAALSSGAEVLVPLSGSVQLIPSLRYTRGLIDLGAGAARGFAARKNSALQFGVGVRRRI
jgi:Outer membrane protein beta-barrel domain